MFVETCLPEAGAAGKRCRWLCGGGCHGACCRRVREPLRQAVRPEHHAATPPPAANTILEARGCANITVLEREPRKAVAIEALAEGATRHAMVAIESRGLCHACHALAIHTDLMRPHTRLGASRGNVCLPACEGHYNTLNTTTPVRGGSETTRRQRWPCMAGN